MFHALLDSTPVWLVYILFALIPAAIAVVVHDQFRRIVRPEDLIPHHEVAGFLVAVVGVLFAVVLAFLVAEAWGTFDSAQSTADGEAGEVAETFASAAVLPEPTRSTVKHLLADYAFEVRDVEFPMLVRRDQDMRARRELVGAFAAVVALEAPKNAPVAVALQESTRQQLVLTNLHGLSEKRRQRLLDAARNIPGDLYLALGIAWLILTAFVFLFGCARALQLTMTGLITAIVGLLFAVVVEFDMPYSHGIRVSTEAWSLVIANNHLADYRDTIAH
jgi:hypothetical protein